MFPWKKYLISLKAQLFRKTYFQIKVIKSGRCHYLGPGWVPWGNFRGNRSCWGSIFMLFPYFVYIAHFPKFTRGSSLFMEKSLLMEKSTAEESPWEKKRKKRQAQRKERVALCQVKNTILLWKRLVLTELHAGAQISNKEVRSNQNLPYIMFKAKFPFLYTSTSLDTKTLKTASNRNFESCMLIICLAPQLCSFLNFCSGFFLCRWPLCLSLCCPPQRSTEQSR